jgi:hypothetical protein
VRWRGVLVIAVLACAARPSAPPNPFAGRPWRGEEPPFGHDVVFGILDPRCTPGVGDCRAKLIAAPTLGNWQTVRARLEHPDTPVAPADVTLVIREPLPAPMSFELRAGSRSGFTRRELLDRIVEVYAHVLSTPSFRAHAIDPMAFEVLWVRLVDDSERHATAWVELQRRP